ncbi:YkvA family protein [Sphingobium sp.]|uniref:YkvA family protein n=1 Tax=Sphingobium sp. TaxID=1912891 RepID=UPI0028BDC306|nr:YkvA family protein [Sphingobium sp.]
MAFQRLKSWAHTLKVDIVALWIAASDSRTPLVAQLVAASVAGLALSPIDLIPDFIPILGYLDDLIILPLGVALAIRLIPPPLLADFRTQARSIAERPKSRAATAIIILSWLGLSVLGCFWALRRIP